MLKFVVQEHQARTHQFDLGLEREGVFKGWAVPKDMAEQPGVKRLTVQVGNHNLFFGSQDGGREARICEGGSYEPTTWAENRIAITLRGAETQGSLNLVESRRGNSRDRLLSRSRFTCKAPAGTLAKEAN